MPEGVGFWSPKIGMHVVDILPWKVGANNHAVKEGWVEEGEDYYERTYWSYRRIGVEEKSYVAPGKTFGHPDPVQDYVVQAAKDPKVDPEYLKKLKPKERQIFLVWVHEEKEKGIQLWEVSFHLFGKLLDERIKSSPENRGWDMFDDPEDGFSLEITISQESTGGYKFNSVKAIDFIKRTNPLPDNIVKHGINPDDMLIEYPYEKLKSIFLGSVDVPESSNEEQGAETGGGEEDDVPFDTGPTAEELGLAVDTQGNYNGSLCKIVRIDTSKNLLTLISVDGSDEIYREVVPVDFEIVKEKVEGTPKEEPKAEEPSGESEPEPEPEPVPVEAAAESDDSDGDGDWDKDWD